MTWYQDQITNNNYLSPIGFKFILKKFPRAAYLCQSANIPGITLGTPTQPTPFKPIPLDGNLTYNNFTITFLVDENLENYLELHNWMRALGVPDSFPERRQFETENTELKRVQKFTDGTLQVLNNNLNANFNVVFKDMFPTDLTTLQFDCTEGENRFFTAEVTFSYSIYEIQNLKGERR